MFSKVRVKKKLLDTFRKKARVAFPLEIQAYLLGFVVSTEEVEITDFVYPRFYHTQTESKVCWYEEEFSSLKERAEREGKRIVADFHSHPTWDSVMSPTDYEGCVTESLLVCGICSIYNKGGTRIRFWTPTSALPCEVTYI